jgi:basic amino acid/polyamine antiporter, APA family
MSIVEHSTSTSTATSSSGSGAAFVRKSSGLVKSGTPWRMFVMSFGALGVGAWMALYYYYGIGPFPQSNVWLVFVVLGVITQFFNLAIAYLAAAYPRSGGDYVFNSRIFSPAVGFISNFGMFCAVCFFSASGAFLLLQIGLAPALQVYGVITSHPSWSHAGTWLADTQNAWLVSAIAVAGFGLLVAFGMKAFWRYQSLTFWIGGILLILLMVVYGFSSHETFVEGFNRYVSTTGGKPATYAGVMAAAQKNGIPHGFTLYDTLGMFAVATAIVGVVGAWIGGEVRTPLRSQVIGSVGGGVVFWILILLTYAAISHTTGADFNRDAAYLALQHPEAWGVDQSPVFTFYAFLCTTSPVILFLMMAGIVVFGAYLVPSQILFPTRMLFAWAFDGLIPSRVADVSPRTNSPLLATLITVIACEVLLGLFGSGQITFINPVLIFGTSCLVATIAATLMPYLPKSRDVYKNSVIKREWFGIPAITIAGAIGAVFWITALYVALTRDTLGANAGSNVRIWLIVFAIPTVYYFGLKLYRRRQGLDLTTTFSELPPE